MYLFQSATLTCQNGFFKWHTDDDSLWLYTHNLHVCKSFDWGESTPVIADTLGGRFSVRNSGVREKKKCFLFQRMK